jgi:hypothetical protein
LKRVPTDIDVASRGLSRLLAEPGPPFTRPGSTEFVICTPPMKRVSVEDGCGRLPEIHE